MVRLKVGAFAALVSRPSDLRRSSTNTANPYSSPSPSPTLGSHTREPLPFYKARGL